MLIDSIRTHLAASKNREYQRRVWLRFEALVEYLDEHGFSKLSLGAKLELDRDRFELTTEQLTDEGNRWISQFYDRWLRSLDRAALKTEKGQYLKSLNRFKAGNA